MSTSCCDQEMQGLEAFADPEHSDGLRTPTRNFFYYGKLLAKYHLDLETGYHNRKRTLVNRLGLGWGVLCGLAVQKTNDNMRVRIGPGVAIDGYGREIVIPAVSRAVNPREIVDACGKVTKTIDPKQSGVVTLCLAYHECLADPKPVLVSECGCEGEERCSPDVVRERYLPMVLEAPPLRIPPYDAKICPALTGPIAAAPGRSNAGITIDLPQKIAAQSTISQITSHISLQASPESDRRTTLCTAVGDKSCGMPQEPCVVLATIELKPDGTIGAIDTCTNRRLLFSNESLLEMILCLADRLERCCGGKETPPPQPPRVVTAISIYKGPNETQTSRTTGAIALVTKNGIAAPNVSVSWKANNGLVRTNLAAPGAPTASGITASNGLSGASWELAEVRDVQILTASLTEDPASFVQFQVTYRPPDPPKPRPPTITDIYPANGAVLTRGEPSFAAWAENPRIELGFSDDMNQDDLNKPRNWLRVWLLGPEDTTELKPIAKSVSSKRAVYTFPDQELLSIQRPRFLIQIRSISISSQAGVPLAADFVGLKLEPLVLSRFWDEVPDTNNRAAAISASSTNAQLPNPNPNPNGSFDSFFDISPPDKSFGNLEMLRNSSRGVQ